MLGDMNTPRAPRARAGHRLLAPILLLAVSLAAPAGAQIERVESVGVPEAPSLALPAAPAPSRHPFDGATIGGIPSLALPIVAPAAPVAVDAAVSPTPQVQPALRPASSPTGARTALAAANSPSAAPSAVFDGLRYPGPPRDETVVDDYFGTSVPDPYRPLEDESAHTEIWVAAQRARTEQYLSGIPERGEILKRLTELSNYERIGLPERHGRHWFTEKTRDDHSLPILYKSRSRRGGGKVLLDPNRWSKDGTVALANTSFSRDGRLLAYAVSRSGSDWEEWWIRDVETGRDLPDVLRNTRATTPAWDKDGKGFFYTKPDGNVYYHEIGTDRASDAATVKQPDGARWWLSPSVTPDGRFLVITQHEGAGPNRRIVVKNLSKPEEKLRPLFMEFDAAYKVVAVEGDRFFVLTTKGAPNGRLVAIDLSKPQAEHWTTLIPESPDGAVLETVERIGKRFVVVWSKDAIDGLSVYDSRGRLEREVELPGPGSISDLSETRRPWGTRAQFTFESFSHPRTHFQLDPGTGRARAFWKPKAVADLSGYEVKQVFYSSKDGTKVPMFIVHKRGMPLDGRNPTYLRGYGGFGVSLKPKWSSFIVPWLERGGVLAVANLRGGGEYGAKWHEAGQREKKQNVFDDFIAAGEYLIREAYTSAEKLAIGGGSNGGLLVGAVMTQRPDLFAAAVPDVAVLDMLRYHLLGGAGWRAEYGTSETKEGFETLIKYSPLHNVKAGTSYPATLVMTGDHDDRVVPAHSYKFAAALQSAQPAAAPILLRVGKDTGHGNGSLAERVREQADKWAFLLRALDVPTVAEAPADGGVIEALKRVLRRSVAFLARGRSQTPEPRGVSGRSNNVGAGGSPR